MPTPDRWVMNGLDGNDDVVFGFGVCTKWLLWDFQFSCDLIVGQLSSGVIS